MLSHRLAAHPHLTSRWRFPAAGQLCGLHMHSHLISGHSSPGFGSEALRVYLHLLPATDLSLSDLEWYHREEFCSPIDIVSPTDILGHGRAFMYSFARCALHNSRECHLHYGLCAWCPLELCRGRSSQRYTKANFVLASKECCH